jgi:hypothetical protein
MNPWDNSTAWGSEKDFMNWLRSQTRRIWSRHPVKISYKINRRFKAPLGVKGKEVWSCNCEICGNVVRSSETQIDHIVMGGSFYDWTTYTEWARRILWVTEEDIRELCVDCHTVVNHMQRNSLTFDEAKKEKAIIAKINQTVAAQKKELLAKGFTTAEVSNEDKRRECYRKLLAI